MKQTIKILDPQEAIKIAAGEVIERPAHIIKELIENSIDAQASTITIHTRAAGKDEISITDDGSGMSPYDANLCFAHHATSKISTVHDLQSISTYGFRGEALSSIASVSHVELTTKTAEEKSGTHLILHYAKIIQEDIAAHPTGTTISITNLFSNIPARKKFLKGDDTEWNLIVSIFQAFCLRKPNIHFKLFHNGHLSYNCPPTSDLKIRCAQLWNSNLNEQLLLIQPTTEKNISIAGALSSPHYYRFNRGQIFTFINNRWVKNIEITKGIMKGYDGVLPTQKYPAAFLFIDIDPTQIDINVHPKKEEVKFLNPGIVQKIVQQVVEHTLNNAINKNLHNTELNTSPQNKIASYHTFLARPTIEETEKLQHATATSNITTKYNTSMPFHSKIENDNLALSYNTPTHNAPTQPKHIAIQNWSITQQSPIVSQAPPKAPITNKQAEPQETNDVIYEQEPFSIIGQFKKTYIMIEKAQQLILVDQHAAHERILYERFKNNINEQSTTVQLLFPHIIKLNAYAVEQLTKHEQLFIKHGIIFEQFSDTEIIIQSTPVQMQAKAVEEIIHLTLNLITEHESESDQFFIQINDKILASKACKAACKAGDTLNHEQMQNLLQELQKTDNRFCCPHGRPTLWDLELKEIEKHFKRDYIGSKQI